MKRWLAIIAALIGLGLFVYVLRQTGLGEIWLRVRTLGAGFGLILLISSSRYLSRTAAWLRCMTPDERRVGFWNLWRARLAGEAVGDLTFGPLVAEPLRLIALGDKLTLKAGVSSLTVENVAYTVTSCLMVLTGAVALLASLSLSDSLKEAVFIAVAFVVALSLPAIILIARRWKLGSALAEWAANAFIHDQIKRTKLAEPIQQLSELEDYVFDFYAKRRRDFLAVLLFETLFHLGGVTEIYTTLTLIGTPVSLPTAFMLEALNRALNIAFLFVPAMVGVDELGTGLVTEALGLGQPAGVALAIIRKIRMFCWIGLGLVFLAQQYQKTRVAKVPNAA
jgi:Lysylphosphatidylglycerol synthase TM region